MNTNKLIKKSILASAISSIILGLTACGGGGSGGDDGNNNVQLSGAVVDAHVAYSRIYVDVDNNGQFDSAYEPYAYTDKEGYFSVSKDGQTNYCDLSPKQYEYRYCFKADEAVKNGGIIRVQGGRDLLTTQVYNASMSLLMNGTLNGLAINPLTSGDEALNNEEVIEAAISSLNLTSQEISDIQTEYSSYLNGYLLSGSHANKNAKTNFGKAGFNFNLNTYNPLEFGSGNVQEEDRGFKLAIQIHKVAEAMAKELLPTSTPIGKAELDIPDLMPSVYFSLFYQLIQNNANTNHDLFKVTAVVNAAYTTAKNILSVRFGSDYTFGNATGNLDTLTAFLNCVLSSDGDTVIDKDGSNEIGFGSACADIREYDTSKSKFAKLYAAELATDVFTKDLTTTISTALLNALKAAQITEDFEPSGNDFSTSSINIRQGGLPNAAVLNFPTNVFEDNYLDFSSPGEKVFADFNPDGTVRICQTDGNGGETLISGNWQQDSEKKHIIYIDYLNLPIVMKNLEPGQTGCGVPGGTCLTLEYPDLTNTNNPGEITRVTAATPSAIDDTSEGIAKPRSGFSCGNQAE